jgi:death on curing protein
LQAAVLAHGIAETQPFLDGNKRTALVAMLTFLEINGYRVQATDRELADWIISFSRRETPQAIAEVLRSRMTAAG